ncbi:MAG: primosomal protein N', partial [Coriobacteriia bacterium]|nr:primosomal protein N' [Coriobacteriia bacterium]
LHSRLSAGERFDQWDMLRSGAARVAVGARSALFAPLQDLRLIVIDEEHEGSYKQSSAPRYKTQDVARRLASDTGALLVLGSATPSMETLAAVQRRQMQRVELPERPNGRPLPPIQVVDLTLEFRQGNKTMYSAALQEALSEVVDKQQKAILLLNRRGFASFLLCRNCGYVPTCQNCSTSMTFHEHPPRLVCHHCGWELPVPARCPDCQSPYLRQLGPGTQYAFDQLQQLLPQGTPIVRMDADSTRGRYGHERRLEEFGAASHGVLLGTQMIAKGLDFPEVTLVGVLIADTALKLPDFRAAERTYQLLEQVAGRAGRAEQDGRVIVQTYWPDHVAIQAAAHHDRQLFLDAEEELRREFFYPPYSRLANILVWGEDLGLVHAAIDEMAGLLRANLPSDYKLLGPSPAVISRRQGQYRWHILVKASIDSDLPGHISKALKDLRPFAEVNRAIDIDPFDLM